MSLGRWPCPGDNVFVAASPNVPHPSGVNYVFTKPPPGWSGTLHESATLSASDGAQLGFSVAATGRRVIATGGGAVYVFPQPAGGWSGTIHESAKLTSSDGASLGAAAVSGATVVASDRSANHFKGAIYVFDEPADGWSGRIHESATLTASDQLASNLGISVAVSGPTVVASGYRGGDALQDGVYMFAEPKLDQH